MCYPKPGPRCSGHALKKVQSAQKHLRKINVEYDNPETTDARRKVLEPRIKKAQKRLNETRYEFSLTPDGIERQYQKDVEAGTLAYGAEKAHEIADAKRELTQGIRDRMIEECKAIHGEDVSGKRLRPVFDDYTPPAPAPEPAQNVITPEQYGEENPYSQTEYLGVDHIPDEIESYSYGIETPTKYYRLKTPDSNGEGAYPDQPYSFRIQVGRELSPEDARKLAGLVGYEYAKTGGETGNAFFQDTPNSIVFSSDTTKGRAYRRLDTFLENLSSTVKEGSPIRKTDRAGVGTMGTRKVPGMGDDIGYIEVYADDASD